MEHDFERSLKFAWKEPKHPPALSNLHNRSVVVRKMDYALDRTSETSVCVCVGQTGCQKNEFVEFVVLGYKEWQVYSAWGGNSEMEGIGVCQ